MKNLISKSLIVAIAFGGLATTALAETNTNASATGTRQAMEQQLKNARAQANTQIKDIRMNLSSTTQYIRDQIKAMTQDKTKNRFNKMVARYQSTIDRELKIMDKINDRIVKIKAAGGNTTEAEKLTADAKTELNLAQTALGTLKLMADNQIYNENTGAAINAMKDGMEKMRKAAKEVETHIRNAHKDLQKSVGVLRGMSQLKNASSTKETN